MDGTALPTNMKHYKYIIDSFDILFPNEANPTKIDPKQVTYLSIEKDYDVDYFPIIRAHVSMDKNLYYKVISNKLNVKFRVRLQKFVYDNTQQFQFKTDVFNEVFGIFMDENTPYMDLKQQTAAKEAENSDKTPKDISNEIQFYLFKDNDLQNSKKIINMILTASSISDAVVYLLSQLGMTQVLMTPFNQTGYRPQIILPALTGVRSLIYLYEQYGFYTNGALMFFDTDCTYIIDKNPKCTAWRKGEYTQTVITVKQSGTGNDLTQGSFVDDKNKINYINVTPGAINMYNDSVINDHIDGNNLLVIQPYYNKIDQINAGTYQRGSGTYKVMTNRFYNEYAISAAVFDKKESGNIVHVNINDFDIDALTPNKEFMFIFEDTTVNANSGGQYRISKTIMTFTKQGEEFAVTGDVEFKRYDK